MRTYCLLAAFVFLRAFGNLCLAWGTKHFSQSLSTNPLTYLEVLLNPYVTLGIAMMIVALLVRLALLGVADLSFVLPMTAIGYVLAALFGSRVPARRRELEKVAGAPSRFHRSGSGWIDFPKHYLSKNRVSRNNF